jgi:hypothetical protein
VNQVENADIAQNVISIEVLRGQGCPLVRTKGISNSIAGDVEMLQ